ncbi:RxLR effector protein [Phytophthora megakarya]|uniref:RxLR effector protein n=1 Tax=Phytophthora megakarya TaxID=4795 RepID=A0A225UPC5_9STRA|nr:RxLR effector protein [Phytophthora megakarya]
MRLIILLTIVITLLAHSEARSLRQSPASNGVGATAKGPVDEERLFMVKTVVADATKATAKKVKSVKMPISKKDKLLNVLAKIFLPKN